MLDATIPRLGHELTGAVVQYLALPVSSLSFHLFNLRLLLATGAPFCSQFLKHRGARHGAAVALVGSMRDQPEQPSAMNEHQPNFTLSRHPKEPTKNFSSCCWVIKPAGFSVKNECHMVILPPVKRIDNSV